MYEWAAGDIRGITTELVRGPTPEAARAQCIARGVPAEHVSTWAVENTEAAHAAEVKSLRDGHAQVADSFARIINGQMWLDGVHIPPYQMAHGIGAHDPDRARKLLMHRREIDRLSHELAVEHLALIPLSFYFKEGRVKVELAVARGRKKADKRQALAARDVKLEMAKAMGRQAKGRD